MAHHDDFYTPEQVDEQLEAMLLTGQASTLDLRLIETLLFELAEQQEHLTPTSEETERVLARVLAHLLREEETSSLRECGTLFSLPSGRREQSKGGKPMRDSRSTVRNGTMDEKDMPLIPAPVSRPKSWKHRFRLIAALLICITLVGSLSLALALMRSQTTKVGRPGTQPASMGAPTNACQDGLDYAEETLCAQGEETILNITRDFVLHGHGASGTIKVTFQRAYADPSRLILIYTIHSSPDAGWGGFMHLSTQQGVLHSGP